MKKLIITLLALCLCLPLIPVPIGTTQAAGTENTDFQTKYDALPKGDTENLYIINSVNAEVKKFPLPQESFAPWSSSTAALLNFPLFLLHWDLSALNSAGFFETTTVLTVSGNDYVYSELLTAAGLTMAKNEGFSRQTLLASAFSGWAASDSTENAYLYNFFNVRKWTDFETRGFSNSSFVTNLEVVSPKLVRDGKVSYQASADYYAHDGFVLISANMAEFANKGETPYIYVNCPDVNYNVTFEYLDSTGAWASETDSYESGTAASAILRPEFPSSPYATFSSWNKGLTTVTADVVYKAVYTYDQFLLTFYNRDGTIAKTERATYYKDFAGYSYSLPDYSVTEGNKKRIFKHTGWTTDPETTSTKVNFAGLKVSQNLSLYPLYEYSGYVEVDETGAEIDTESGLSKWWNAEWDIFGAKLPIGKITVIVAVILLLPVILWLAPMVFNLIKGLINGIKNLFSGVRRRRS